ncbi:hypothetical protein [Bradyrhizobium sp. CB1015]|uniref:hypothetical protein n=1 Tax=Bradyrhizobium sp. CB1015 TaxID=2976822 RepID=UPI0021AA3256|nr:hypothetical protein [Bradyrhizobium sp. CB1015]UWU90779.1 hypothetical protein N2604_30625 [Bradyrhizobium sp. CB1015]
MSVLIKNTLGSAQSVQLCFSGCGILSFALQLKDRSLLICKASFSLNYIALDLPQRIIDEGLVHQCAQLAAPISPFSINLSGVSTFPLAAAFAEASF